MTVNIALRRQMMQLQHFTTGNVPPGLLTAPEGWNAEQIRQFQEWFDSVLAGNTGARTRLVWAPSGTAYQAFTEAPYKDEFDEWLARIVCYAFSLPPTAFMRQVNRATAETAQHGGARRRPGAAEELGQAARRSCHPGPDGPCRSRIRLDRSAARPTRSSRRRYSTPMSAAASTR